MSYLHVPRIYFGGLFFTNPATINNYDYSYDTDVELTKNHQYRTDGGQGGPGGWNPMGTARFYLENCRVLAGIGPDRTHYGLGAGDTPDPLIGALVATPSPTTPTAPDGVSHPIAKLVDLDPDQQARSEVYGMRVWVEIPGASTQAPAGFWGTMSVPQLRNMGGRIDTSIPGIPGGSWTAVGTLTGIITDVVWLGDVSSSKLLGEFESACAGGISYRLTVDLHQNDPTKQFTSGDQLYYGRVHGCFGPAYPGKELAQVVPGRMLQVPPAPPQATSTQTRVAMLAAIAAAPSVTLNASPALVVTVADGSSSLAVDLGGASLLVVDTTANDRVLGKYQVDRGIEFGTMNGSDFVPFAAAAVGFTDQYDDRLIGNSEKSCYLVGNTGIVDIPLTSSEVETLASAPLALRVDGGVPVLQEYANGSWIELSQASWRMQPNETSTLQMMARQFGAPVTGSPALAISVFASNWSGAARPFINETEPSTVVQVGLVGELDANGIIDVKVSSGTPEPLGTLRTFMDSKVYFAQILDPDGNPIGDQPAEGYALSVLLWAGYPVPTNPTWDADVGPILQSYSRLYPGMKGLLDIGDEATVLGSAQAIHDRMSLPPTDAGYMPVTRDLSPNKIATVVNWLAGQLPPAPPRNA